MRSNQPDPTAVMIAALALAILLSSPSPGFRVIDGDTVAFGKEHARLAAIDAPESNQLSTDVSGRTYNGGTEATQHLIALIANRPVSCVSADPPQYSYRGHPTLQAT